MKAENIERIITYFEENEDIFIECIEELDSYNGYLGDDRYYPMDELNEHFSGQDPVDILYRAFHGHDDDNWTTDEHGLRVYREFNPNREYFYYNGYGNLVSSNYRDYSNKLGYYFVEDLAENRQHIYTIEDNEELNKLFDAMEEEVEE